MAESRKALRPLQLDLEIASLAHQGHRVAGAICRSPGAVARTCGADLQIRSNAALAAPDNAEVLGWANTDAVLARFTVKILEDESANAAQLTPERFKQLVNEVKAETGAKGKELFHPIRIVITGSHSGPEFDRLIPILEAGSRLKLPRHVLSVRERVEEFARQRSRKA